MKATVSLDHELLAVEGEHTVHAMLELVAPAQEGAAGRPALNLALVIDRSGSMAGPKLDQTKAAAEYLVRRLGPQDRLALVTYDDEIELRASLGVCDHETLIAHIRSIWPGGSTNLSGGWLKGVEELRRADGDGVRKVLLLTDGLANHGITDAPSLEGMATKVRGTGVGTTTIGYGAGFNEELLTAMADAGGGNAHYAASPEDAPGIFAQEFTDLADLVAQNLSVEIRPTEDVKVLGILNEYPATSVGGGVQLALGDVYGEENRRVVFELNIPEMAKLGVCKVADVVIRYVSTGAEVSAHELTVPLVINMVAAGEAAGALPNQDVVEEVLILKAARAQKEARERADHGDYEGAQMLLRTSAEELRAVAPNSTRADELLEEAKTLEGHAALASPDNYGAQSSKEFHYNARRMHQS
ncbi:MAG: vWA domain-containing protein, partial [Actinomycetota bacterium]